MFSELGFEEYGGSAYKDSGVGAKLDNFVPTI